MIRVDNDDNVRDIFISLRWVVAHISKVMDCSSPLSSNVTIYWLPSCYRTSWKVDPASVPVTYEKRAGP